MAREKKRIIEIDTGSASKSVSQLKEEISGLKQQLDAQNISEQEATQLSNQLAKAQKTLAESTDYVKSNSEKLGKSYTALQEQLKKLKQQYQSTTNEITRNDIGEAINTTTRQIREMEGSAINAKTSISGFGNVLSQVGGSSCSTLVNGISGISGALSLLKSHPMIAIIAGATMVLSKIVSKIKENEAAMEAFREAFAPLSGIAEVVNKWFTKALISVANLIKKLNTGLINSLKVISTVIRGNKEDVEKLRLEFPKLVKVTEFVVKAFDSISDAAKRFGTAVVEAIRKAWPSIKDFAINTGNFISNAFNKSVEAVKRFANLCSPYIKNAWNSIKDFSVNAYNSISSAFNRSWQTVKDFAGKTGNAIYNAFSPGINAVKRFNASVIEALKNTFVTISDWANKTGSKLSTAWNKSSLGIKTNEIATKAWTATLNIVVSAITKITESFNKLKNKVAEVGKSFKEHLSGFFKRGKDNGVANELNEVAASSEKVESKLNNIEEQTEKISESIKESATSFKDLDTSASDVNTKLDEIKESHTQIVDEVTEEASKLSEVEEISTKVTDDFKEQKTAAEEIKDSVNDVSDSFEEYKTVQSEVTESTKEEKTIRSSIADELDKVISAMESAKNLAEEKKNLEEDTLNLSVEQADAQVRIAELEQQKSQSTKDSTEQAKLQSQINEERTRLAEKEAEIAAREYAIIKSQIDLETASASERKKLNDAYVKMQQTKAEAIKAETQELKSTSEEVKVLEGSYNALTAQLSKLKEQWKATNDEAERIKIAGQIKEVDKQLTEMEGSLGAAKGRFSELFQQVQQLGIGGAGSLADGIKKVNAAAKLLYANPIIALVAVLGAVIMGIVKAIKRNEEALDRLKIAVAPLQGIFRFFKDNAAKLANAISRTIGGAIDSLTTKIKNTTTFLANAADKLGLDSLAEKLRKINETMDKQKDITKSLIELNHKRDDIARDNADLELEISKLQADFIRNEGNLQKQKEITNKIEANTLKIRQNNLELAKEEYRVAELNKDGSEERNQAADEAYVKMKQAEAEIYQLTKEQRKVIKQEAKDVKEVETELDKLLKKLEEFRQSEEDQILLLDKQYEQELKLLGNNYAAIDLLTKKWQKERKELELNNAKDTINTITDLYEEAGNTISKTYLEALAKANNDYLRNGSSEKERLEAVTQAEKEQMQQRIKASVEYINALRRQRDVMLQNKLDTTEIEKLITAAILENTNLRIDAQEAEIEEHKKKVEEERNAIREELELLSEYTTAITSLGDGLSSAWSGVFTIALDGLNNVWESLDNGEKKWKTYSKVAVASLNTAASIMNALAEEEDENTEEGFKQRKAFEIASTIMTGLAGIVAAWTSALSPENAWMTLPGQLAMGAVSSALIGTLMGVQIAQIKKQTLDNNTSAASVSSGAMKSILAPVQYTSDVPSAYSEVQASDSRVYVLESDITKTQRKVSVTESESRF